MHNKKQNTKFSCFSINGKKAQIGETMTWVVATLIIVIILAISIYAVSFNFGERKFNVNTFSDLYAVKSLSGYMLTGDIYGELNRDGNFTVENGNFAVEIFRSFYGEDYYNVWLGFSDEMTNDYFGKRASGIIGDNAGIISLGSAYEKFKLNNGNEIDLILIENE